MLNRWVHVSVAVLLYIVDFLVLSLQAFFSDSEQILYGILALVLNTLILNRVMLMGKSQIQLFVISDKYEEVKRRMLLEVDVGATMVHIEPGSGTRQQKGVLCVIPGRKLYLVNEMMQNIDVYKRQV